jgi:hypothetical protein
MTSLQSHIVQIPRNAHFRAVPALTNITEGVSTPNSSFFTFVATSGVAPRLTNPGPGAAAATGNFILHPAMASDAGAIKALSLGIGLLKDLGETIVSSGRTFRRVQVVTQNADSTGQEKMGGVYGGYDYDALAGYIELGLRGIGAAGPFVRAL